MSTCLPVLKPGVVLNDTWVLGERLGEGACGQVFSVHLQANDKKQEPFDMIIKCAYKPEGKSKKAMDQIRSANTLFKEYQMHRGPLLGFKYAPGLPSKHRPTGQDLSHCYFVMQRLDYTLEELANRGSPPSLQSVSRIGIEILTGLRDMHRRGYVFVDIKPDNFMVLKDPKASKSRSDTEFFPEDKLFFVDFGLMEKTRSVSSKGSGQRENVKRADLAGNACYCSLDVHECNVPAFKDDLEALGYMLLSLLNGAQLPWSNARSSEECLRLKKNSDLDDLAASFGCPPLSEFISSLRCLHYDDKPDYDHLLAILNSVSHATKSGMKTNPKSKAASTLAPIEDKGQRKSATRGKSSAQKGKAAKKIEKFSSKRLECDEREAIDIETTVESVVTGTRPKKMSKQACATEAKMIVSVKEKRGKKSPPRRSARVKKVINIASSSSGDESDHNGDKVVALDSDSDEDSVGSSTPVKTKDHKVTSPSPFLKRKIASVSACEDSSNPQLVVNESGEINLNSSSLCNAKQSSAEKYETKTRRSSSRKDISVEAHDSEEDEEEAGNTPVKIKRHKVTSPSPFLTQKVETASSSSVTGPFSRALDNVNREDETPTIPLLERHITRNVEEDTDNLVTKNSATRRRKRPASSPFYCKQEAVDVSPYEKENTSNISSARGALNDRRERAPQLYMEVITSDCVAYIGTLWPISLHSGTTKDGTSTSTISSPGNSWGNMQVVGSDNCEICLEDDEYLSGRHALFQPVMKRSSMRLKKSSSKNDPGFMEDEISLNVKDLKSTNGTRINGVRITPNRWANAKIGDVIQLGKTEVVIRTIY